MTGEPAERAGSGSGRRWATAALVTTALLSVYVLFVPDPAGSGTGPPGSDKAVHLVLFGLLAATSRWRLGPALPVVLTVAAYAALSEVVQAVLLPTRSGDVVDLAADLVGAGLGWLIAGQALASASRR